jgi:hypothetical protein
MENIEYQALEILNSKMKKYFPDFSVVNAEAQLSTNLNYDESGVVILLEWSYANKFGTTSITLIKWNNQYGTLFGDVYVYNPNSKGSQSGISSKVINNIIRTINTQLNEQ